MGDGHNRWPATHVTDVARLYRLVLEKHEDGSKYHAVDEEGVTLRDIAQALGRALHLPVVSITPEEAPAHFGFLAMFVSLDICASSAMTRQRLGWEPSGVGMSADLDRLEYGVAT